jgi:cobalt-zinc-cadmium resistance protein CzcA
LQAGFGIPLFFGAQHAKINAEKLKLLISENNYQSSNLALQNEYKKAMQQYELCLKKVEYFEKEANQLGDEMLSTTMQQYQSGNINYLEWALLHNQIISIKTAYLNAVKEYNFSAIEINFLNNK